MISADESRIYLDDELAGAQAWAARHRVPLTWVPESVELRVTLIQSETSEGFFLLGHFDNYREIAPAWTFTDATWSAAPQQHFFPRPTPPALGVASIFHTQRVICAPFNRLAYKDYRGPHQDWGGPANWLTAGQPNEIKAHYLGDMLAVIHRHFSVTRGRMG